MTQEHLSELDFHVHVHGLIQQPIDLDYSDFKAGTLGASVDVHPIVPAFTGMATRVATLLEMVKPRPDCTHVIFHASDEFQATLPLTDLQDALFLFQQEEKPLKKGFPVRLLVPNGSSDCLNVKSVVEIEFVRQEEPEQEATFGFKNIVSAEQL